MSIPLRSKALEPSRKLEARSTVPETPAPQRPHQAAAFVGHLLNPTPERRRDDWGGQGRTGGGRSSLLACRHHPVGENSNSLLWYDHCGAQSAPPG